MGSQALMSLIRRPQLLAAVRRVAEAARVRAQVLAAMARPAVAAAARPAVRPAVPAPAAVARAAASAAEPRVAATEALALAVKLALAAPEKINFQRRILKGVRLLFCRNNGRLWILRVERQTQARRWQRAFLIERNVKPFGFAGFYLEGSYENESTFSGNCGILPCLFGGACWLCKQQ